MLVVGAVLGGAAGREGAFGVQHPGEMTQVLSGVVAGRLMSVVAVAVEVFEFKDDPSAAVLV